MLSTQSRLMVRSIVQSTLARRNLCSAAATPAANYAAYETLLVEQPQPFVFHVQLNRPAKLNALSPQMWTELTSVFDNLSDDPDCRAIVLSGRGKLFTAGLDLIGAAAIGQQLAAVDDVARKAKILSHKIRAYQSTVTSLERCAKPVLAAVHSGCVGAGVDLITAADVRYCTQDAWFTVKEVDIGMAADVGTLQRLPKVVGNQSVVREWCLTGRRFGAAEAEKVGLLSAVFETHAEMVAHAMQVAADIAAKSPVAVQATKKNLVYSLDHTTQEGLDQIYEMNRMLLQSEDFQKAIIASVSKGDPPVFSKL